MGCAIAEENKIRGESTNQRRERNAEGSTDVRTKDSRSADQERGKSEERRRE